MPSTSSGKALSRNTDLPTGPERPAGSALQGREAAVPGLCRDLSLWRVLFLCLQEGPGSQRTPALVLKGEKDESPGPCVGSSSLRPRSSRILWKLHAQKPGSLFFSVAQKLSSVSPRAITTSSLWTGGSWKTRPSQLRSLSSPCSIVPSSWGLKPRLPQEWGVVYRHRKGRHRLE